MSKELQFYVVGDGKKPDWFIAESGSGRIKMVYDDGDFLYASVSTVGGVKKALEGDVIVKQKSGLSVLTREQAIKFKLIGTAKKTKLEAEVKEDDEQ